MLTKEEQDFIDYWEKNRLKERSFSRQLRSGLYPGLFFAAGILLMVFSGWYKRADMSLNSDRSSWITIVVAVALITVVYAVFYKRQQWDRKEQQYTELMIKKEKEKKLNQV